MRRSRGYPLPMPRLTQEIDIARAPDVVFAFLADFANDPKWRANVIAMRPLGRPEDTGGVWSRQIEVRQVPGRTVESEAVVAVYDPPRTLSVKRAGGPIRPEATYRLEPSGPNGDGTRLTFRLEIPLAGAAWLALPAVWLFMRLAIRPVLPADLARLKHLLEAS
jgi:hypothetical protein